MRFRLALALIFLFSFTIASADEAIFAWTYTTDLLPKGRWEFEQGVTSRWEKEHGTYSVLDFREELEYGLTDDFQIALYLNHHYVNANDEVPVADATHPKKRLPGISRMNRDACYKRVRVHPWIWRVLKPAQEFSRNTGGIFDITMAGQLVKWNYLPR